jgi:oxidoreductase
VSGGPGRAPLRVAIVGLGWAALHIWLPRLRAHPAYTVAALVDPDPVARAAVLPQEPAARAVASVGELVPGTVDLAVVAVPNHLHCPIACQLLEAGIPVFVEKPVCLRTAEADQLATAERAGGGPLLAGSAARHRADVRRLYTIAADLGRIRHIEVSWVRASGVPDAGGWFTRRRLSGGGALVDLGWHLFDVVAPLLGGATFDQVVAITTDDFISSGTADAAWREPRSGDVGGGGDVEDTARGFLVTDTGVSVALRASWASHEPYDSTLITVDGSAGAASLRCTFGFSPNRPGGSSMTRTRLGRSVAVPLAGEPIGTEYHRQLDDIAARLADPASPGRAVADAARTVGVIERLYASARQAHPDGRRILQRYAPR